MDNISLKFFQWRMQLWMNFIIQKEKLFATISQWGWVTSASNGLSVSPREIAKIIITLCMIASVILVSAGYFFVPSVFAGQDHLTSPALEDCRNTPPSTIWFPKRIQDNQVVVDIANMEYPANGGRLRVDSATILWTLLYAEDNLEPQALAKHMITAQTDAWDSDHDLKNGPFEAYVNLEYWQKMFDESYAMWGKDPALVAADIVCFDLPTKQQMAQTTTVSLFNSIEEMIAKVPGFNTSDFNRANSPAAQLALQKVVELNCKNLRLPTSTKTEAECTANFKATTLTGPDLVNAIKAFYADPTPFATATPLILPPPIEVTTYPQGLSPTQAADLAALYNELASTCGEDPRCIGQKWDEKGYTFSDNVISQINEKCADLSYCRGLVVLYRGQGYDENTALAMALQKVTEANGIAQTKSCTWEQVTSSQCVPGAAIIYIYNEGGGIDTGIAIDAGGNIMDTIDEVTGVPYDTSRSRLVPIPPGTTSLADWIDPYGNFKGGLIISNNALFSGDVYYVRSSSIYGYDCFDEQGFHQAQVGSVWAYPSQTDPMWFCPPVITPDNTPAPSNPDPVYPPLEAGLVAQGANVNTSIVLSMDCAGAMNDGNYYFFGSGFSLSIHNSYLPENVCPHTSNNTIYIATSAGQASAGAGTGWTLLYGETDLYWAKRWP